MGKVRFLKNVPPATAKVESSAPNAMERGGGNATFAAERGTYIKKEGAAFTLPLALSAIIHVIGVRPGLSPWEIPLWLSDLLLYSAEPVFQERLSAMEAAVVARLRPFAGSAEAGELCDVLKPVNAENAAEKESCWRSARNAKAEKTLLVRNAAVKASLGKSKRYQNMRIQTDCCRD